MTNDKINNCDRVRKACAYEPDSIRYHANGSSAGGVTPQSWTSTWHRARPGSSNNVTREYAWGLNMGGGIGGLLNVKQSGQNYSYLYDGKGNVTAVIDGAEATAATYTYDAFGNLKIKTGSLDQPFQFSTKRYDAQTGLVYYGYRLYSPAMGRWITRDPLGIAGGINLYVFVGGNPVVFVDPYGLESVLNNPKVRTIASAGGAALAEYVASEMEPGKLRGGVYLVSAILSLDSAVSATGVAIASFTVATMTLPTGVSTPVAVVVGITATGVAVYDLSLAQEYLGKAIDDLTGDGNCPINN